MPHIKAKPTKRGNVTFRSRTEARWSLYFENSDAYPNHRRIIYEPKHVFDDYVPDFQVAYVTGYGLTIEIWEIKPKTPTVEYFDEWRARMWPIVGQERVSGLLVETYCFLGIGSFFRHERPTVIDAETCDRFPLAGSIDEACEWRFDL